MNYKKKLDPDGCLKFSKQEKKVFELLITEHKNSEIAKIMGLNDKTIGSYKLRLLKKSKSKTIIGLYLFNQTHKIVEIIGKNSSANRNIIEEKNSISEIMDFCEKTEIARNIASVVNADTVCNVDLEEQAKQDFENVFMNFEFHKVRGEIIMFWQVKEQIDWEIASSGNLENRLTLDNLVEGILTRNSIEIDSHCCISYDKNFAEQVFWVIHKIKIQD